MGIGVELCEGHVGLGRGLITGGGDFKFLLSRRATRCIDGEKFGVKESTEGAEVRTYRSQNCKFYEISEYKRSSWAYSLRNFFSKFSGFCGQFLLR